MSEMTAAVGTMPAPELGLGILCDNPRKGIVRAWFTTGPQVATGVRGMPDGATSAARASDSRAAPLETDQGELALDRPQRSSQTFGDLFLRMPLQLESSDFGQ